MSERSKSGLWAIIGACAATVIAGSAVITLTATAQNFILEERRDTANEIAKTNAEIAKLSEKIDKLVEREEKFDEKLDAFITQAELDAAMKALVAQIFSEFNRTTKKPPPSEAAD